LPRIRRQLAAGRARGAERGWKGNAVVEREDDARGPRPASIICHPGFLFLRRGSPLARHPRPSASGAALAFPPGPPSGFVRARTILPLVPNPARVSLLRRPPPRRRSPPRRRHAWRGVSSGRAAAGGGAGRGGGPVRRARASPYLPTKRLPLYYTVLYSPLGKNKAIGKWFKRPNDNLSAKLERERG